MTVASPAIQTTDLEAFVCRDSLQEFVRSFWEAVPGAGKLVWSWHLEVFCDELQSVAERVFAGLPRLYDLVINVSPGTSKSTVASILFPAWAWTRMPECRFLTGSYADSLVMDLSNKARHVIKNPKYRQLFPEVVLREDQDAKGHYATTLGGERITCTVGGRSPLGKHAHILIIDDAVDPKEVLSSALREEAGRFMTEYIANRKVDKQVSATILIMQRLGVGDPTDVMIEQSRKHGAAPVRHVCLPAELDKDEHGGFKIGNVSPPELAKRYVDGLMDPKRLGRTVLDENIARGALFYATQFLQRPYVAGAGMFQESYFAPQTRVKAAPYDARRVCYWDLARSIKDSACNSVGTVVHEKDGEWFVGPVRVGRWDPDTRDREIVSLAQYCRDRWGPNHEPTHVIEQEPAAGIDVCKHIIKKLAGFKAAADPAKRNKELRAQPWAAQCASTNVRLVDDGSWDVAEWVKEHCVTGDTMVITNQGLKHAEHINIGDMVLTHRGRFRPVERIQSRMADALQVIKAKGCESLHITPEHRVWAMSLGVEYGTKWWNPRLVGKSLDWTPAAELKPREYKLSGRGQLEPTNASCDAMTFPVLAVGDEVSELDLRAFFNYSYLANHNKHKIEDDGEFIRLAPGRSQPLRYRQRLDYVFGRFCGFYLAEGSSNAEFTFHRKEVDYHEEIRDFALTRLGVRSQIKQGDKYPNTSVVAMSLPRLAGFFDSFGRRAPNKRIPSWAWSAPKEFQRGLMDGWVAGDGGGTVSPHLAWGMRLICTRFGIWPSMTISDNRGIGVVVNGKYCGVSRHKAYWLSMKEKKYSVARWLPEAVGLYVEANTAQEGRVKVWNFEVAEDNSYTTTGGCVHNCAFPNGARVDRVDSAAAGFNWLLLRGPRAMGQFRVMRSDARPGAKKGVVRFMFSSRDRAEWAVVQERALVVTIQDPVELRHHLLASPSINGSNGVIANGDGRCSMDRPAGVSDVVGVVELEFVADEPVAFQERWSSPVAGTVLSPTQVLMRPEHGKRFWSAMLRQRPLPVEVVIFLDDGDGSRAKSMAFAACDSLHFKRSEVIHDLTDIEWIAGDEQPPCKHVYDQTRNARNLVVG